MDDIIFISFLLLYKYVYFFNHFALIIDKI